MSVKRSVIRLGTKTLLVSLPSGWARKYGIEKGHELDVQAEGPHILIRAKAEKSKPIEIDISGFDSSLIWYNLIGAYRQGVNLLSLKFTDSTVWDRKTLKKVSLHDLVGALQKALKVDQRRTVRRDYSLDIPEVIPPTKKVNINELMDALYSKITNLFKTNKDLTFTKLVPSGRREDKIATFGPLLHLDHQRKIDLHQEKHFSEIYIKKREENNENNNLH